jgi:hypothetical protein
VDINTEIDFLLAETLISRMKQGTADDSEQSAN